MPALSQTIFDRVVTKLKATYTGTDQVRTGELDGFYAATGQRPLLHVRSAGETRTSSDPRPIVDLAIEIRCLVRDEFGNNTARMHTENDTIVQMFDDEPTLTVAGVIWSAVVASDFDEVTYGDDAHILARLVVRYARAARSPT